MKRSRLLGLVAILVLASIGVAFGLSRLGADRIEAAIAAVDREAWSEALDALDRPSALPPSTAALVDRGWIAWQSGDLPRAIAAWRAARQLSPRDDDLAHDLALARATLEGAPEPVPAAPTWSEIATPGEVGALALVAWLIASSLAVGWRRGRATALQAGLALLPAGILTVLALQGRAVQRGHPLAVTVEDAAARDGAALDAGERFTLPPGAELRAVTVDGAFVLIEDAAGRRGWVLGDALEIPDPGAILGGVGAARSGSLLP